MSKHPARGYQALVVLIALCIGFFVYPSVAAIIGDADNRMTYSKYAAEMFGGDLNEFYARFSGSGVLYCDDSFESASLVLRKDVLVVAGHSVVERDTRGKCGPKANLSACYFQIIREDGSPGRKVFIQPQTLRTSRTLLTDCNFRRFSDDWAIVGLRETLTEIEPYVPYNAKDVGSIGDGFQRLRGKSIIAMAGRNENLKGFSSATPTVCDGKLGYVWSMEAPDGEKDFALGIDCSSGRGNSGGAILMNQGPRPRFIGVITSSGGPERDNLPFDNKNYTGGPLLQGEFYETLMKFSPPPRT